MLWLLAVHAAWADANLNGDLKSFNLVSFPYEAPLLFPSTDPMAQAVVDGRLKGELTFNPERGPRWRPRHPSGGTRCRVRADSRTIVRGRFSR